MRRAVLLGLTVLAVAVGCGGDGPESDEALSIQTLDIVTASGPFAAVDHLKAHPDPVLAVRTVNRVILRLFHAKHDLAGALTVGRAGLGMAKEKADRLEGSDAQRAREIRALMRHIAWNLGTFTWPGWGREGLRKADLEVGMKAARMSLKMAKSLELSDAELSSSWWLLGAHLMAAGEHAAAHDAFKSAADLATSNRKSLLSAYVGLALVLRGGRHKVHGEQIYERSLSILQSATEDEAAAFAAELTTARRVFLRKTAAASGAPRSVTAGPLTLEIVASRTARHFAVVSHLARGLYPKDSLPLTDGDRKRLDRFAGLLARKPELGRYFFTTEAPTGALFEAAGAGEITPSEVTDLSTTFESLASRIDVLLASRRLDAETFAAALDVKKLEAIATKAATFTKVKSLAVTVWPIPAEPGKPRCRFEDGRIVIELNPNADPSLDLVYGVAQAFLFEREDDILPVLATASRESGTEFPARFHETLSALLVEGGPKAEARNLAGGHLLSAIRLSMEVDGWALELEASDPLTAFLRATMDTAPTMESEPRKPK